MGCAQPAPTPNSKRPPMCPVQVQTRPFTSGLNTDYGKLLSRTGVLTSALWETAPGGSQHLYRRVPDPRPRQRPELTPLCLRRARHHSAPVSKGRACSQLT